MKSFLNDISGVSAIQYGLIAGFVALSSVAAVTEVGSQLGFTFGDVSYAMSDEARLRNAFASGSESAMMSIAEEIVASSTEQEVKSLASGLWRGDVEARTAAFALAIALNQEGGNLLGIEGWGHMATNVGWDNDGDGIVDRDLERILEITESPGMENSIGGQWLRYSAYNALGERNSSEAIAALQRITEIDPGTNTGMIRYSSWMNYQAYARLGDGAAARESLETAASLGHEPAQNVLNRLIANES